MFSKAREKIISKINKIIETYRKSGAAKEGTNNGVLGRLLEEDSLPDEAVADFIINLLFAGNETTTKTMLFAVYFLTQSPNAMKELLVCIKEIFSKSIFSYLYPVWLNNLLISATSSLAQDEQDSLRTNSREEFLTWQDYKAMPFTQCVSD